MNEIVTTLIKMALREDIESGDITTQAIVDKERNAKAEILVKENGVVAGLPLAQIVFDVLDKRVKLRMLVKDGTYVKAGTRIAEISGNAQSILTGERLVLNFLQRMSGIATLTDKYVAKVKGTKAVILDTRKTVPLWRGSDKYAVLAGGGQNHRFGLFDAVLIKDNHLKFAPISEAIKKCQATGKPVEIEVTNISQVNAAILSNPDRILLDNMNLKTLKSAVKLCKKAGIQTEASGGVNLKTVRAIAKTGVDYISIGELTHSPKALDVSLEII